MLLRIEPRTWFLAADAFLIKNFHIIYFDYIFSLLNSSQILSSSLPPQLHILSLALKKKKKTN